MPGRLIKALVFVALVSAFAADISVGCGGQYVYGPVDQKIRSGGGGGNLIRVQGEAYEVPLSFFDTVQVGDIVKYNGNEWSIVKRASQPEPVTAPPSSSSP
jgi:hypothetical protein